MRVVVVGRLGRPHALRGEMTLQAFHRRSTLWEAPEEAPARLRLLPEGIAIGTPKVPDVVELPERELKVVSTWSLRALAKGKLAIRLGVVGNRTAAEKLTGRLLGVAEAELVEDLAPPTAEAEGGDLEFYYYEVPGWEVVDGEGDVIGEVVRALDTHVDVFEVRPSGGGPTFFVPVVAPLIRAIERPTGRVVVDGELLADLLP